MFSDWPAVKSNSAERLDTDDDSTTIAYRVGWLIDGTGNPAVENRIVTIDGSRIQAILAPNDPQPAGMTIVDLSDCTVFPALIDSHVHLVMSGSTEPSIRQKQLKSTYTDRRKTIAEHLRQHLACGVLAVRDGGDHNGDTLRYKRDTGNHPPTLVTIASPGRARHAPGRYGKLIGIPVEAGMTLAQSAFRDGFTARSPETGQFRPQQPDPIRGGISAPV